MWANLTWSPAEDPDLMMIECLDSRDPPRTVHPSSSGWQSQWERSKTWDCEPTTVSEVARTWCEPSSGPATVNTSSPEHWIMTTFMRIFVWTWWNIRAWLRDPQLASLRGEKMWRPVMSERQRMMATAAAVTWFKLFLFPVRHHLIEERWGPSWRWFLWDRWGWCARRRSGMLVWS